MSDQQTSKSTQLWSHVADLRPQLRPDVRLLPHTFRGENWYVLQDESSGRFIRFNTSAYQFLRHLDGARTVADVLQMANEGVAEAARLSPDDAMHIMAKLRFLEVLRGGLPLSAKEKLDRFKQSPHLNRKLALNNPLALRIPLFDPDGLLNSLAPLARVVFSRPGMAMWLMLIMAALLLGIIHFNELATAISSKHMASTDLLLLLLVYPSVKAIHELGHCLAVKAWGGEVHETGITLLVFMPVPYMDGSASWAFPDKRKRALVGAAGIFAELFLAALGIIVWVMVEPGLVQDIALNVALIGSVSTLLFNANPLLRFDGYQILSDLIEIPNLSRRSSQYYIYLMQRYALGLNDVRSPISAKGERPWFVFYGLASPVYRIMILVSIAFYLVDSFFVIGVVLASWVILMQVIKPVYNCLQFLVISQRTETHRLRGFAIVGAALLVISLILLMPIPLTTHAEGVVWMDDKAQVVATNDGFVSEVLVPSGRLVADSTPLIRMEDERLTARSLSLQAKLVESQVLYGAELRNSKLGVAMVREDIAVLQARLQQTRKQLDELLIPSRTQGGFITVDSRELTGRYFKKGDVLGYVVNDSQSRVRVVIEQERIGLIRSRQTRTEILLAHELSVPLPATLLREVPAANTQLPSVALGAAGGGVISVDMNDETGYTSSDNVFQLDLMLPEGVDTAGIGERVYVRFNHGYEPLLQQLRRNVQQLFLSRLNG